MTKMFFNLNSEAQRTVIRVGKKQCNDLDSKKNELLTFGPWVLEVKTHKSSHLDT